MDIPIKKRHNVRASAKWYLAGALLTLSVFSAAKYISHLSQAEISVDRDSLTVAEVKRGQFTASVHGTGVLALEDVQWISANVEGTVTKQVVKAGNIVQQGDLILELSNPAITQRLAEAEYELEALKAELDAARVSQESVLQQQESKVLEAKLEHETSLLEYEAHSQLIKTNAVSKLDFERSRLAVDQFHQRWIASKEQLSKMHDSLLAQNSARTARVNQAIKRLAIIQQQVNDLNVRANADSIVLDVPLQLGQRVVMGTSIAKLAQKDSLIAELQVPEIQIGAVSVGQKAIIDTRNNKVAGLVSRIDPAVINGTVQVDIRFDADLPADARPDLSINGEIFTADISDAMFVERPLFSQSESSSRFFKISDNGDFMESVRVETGYGSINLVQIIEGLEAGDKIVTSYPSKLDAYQKVRIR